MKIEFEWNDLVDLVDEASSDDINRIAHAISDIINVVNSNDGGNVDLSDYYTKEEVDNKDNELQQDISGLQADIVGKEEKSNRVSSGLALFENDYHEDVSDDKYPTTKLAHEWALEGYNLGSVANQRLDNDYYTKEEIDLQANQYARVSDLDAFYTMSEVDIAISNAIGVVLGGAS